MAFDSKTLVVKISCSHTPELNNSEYFKDSEFPK